MKQLHLMIEILRGLTKMRTVNSRKNEMYKRYVKENKKLKIFDKAKFLKNELN